MKRTILTLVMMLMTPMAQAQSAPSPVVVELYTSQGCSSCPSADRLLEKLAGREDVLPLSLHVDYWDYIGWVDTFADPAFTKRQKAYARAMKERMIYTPQMIIDGDAQVVGNRPIDVADALNAARADQGGERLDARFDGGTLMVRAHGVDAEGGPYVLQFISYIPSATVQIKRGENAGREITYLNVVNGWHALGEWDGQGTFNAQLTLKDDDKHAVILQEKGHGAVLAAARLR